MAIPTAVVGCGSIAQGAHLPNLSGSPNFDLRIVCDRDDALAGEAAAQWSVPETCTDWRRVVESDGIELIVLCTHTNLRAELICAAARAGKAVYAEKPLAANFEEMLRIEQVVGETGAAVCVGHNRRSSPAVEEFRRLFDLARERGADRPAVLDRTGGVREPIPEETRPQLLLRVNDDARTWKPWVFEDREGILLIEMVHFIDLALWLMGRRPVEVDAVGSNRGNVTAMIRFDDDSAATLFHTMVGNFDYPKELFEATARNVTIALDHHLEVRQRGLEDEPFRSFFPLQSGAELTDRPGIEGYYEATDRLQELRRAGGEAPCPMVFPNKGHAEHMERFGRHLRGDGPNPCPVDGAVLVTRVGLRLLESAREGRRVSLGEEPG